MKLLLAILPSRDMIVLYKNGPATTYRIPVQTNPGLLYLLTTWPRTKNVTLFGFAQCPCRAKEKHIY